MQANKFCVHLFLHCLHLNGWSFFVETETVVQNVNIIQQKYQKKKMVNSVLQENCD